MTTKRQLDKWIAIHLFSKSIIDFTARDKNGILKDYRQPYYSWAIDGGSIHWASQDDIYLLTGEERAGCPQVTNLPEYSSSLEDAWEVIKYLELHHFKWEIHSRNPLMSDSRIFPLVDFSLFDHGKIVATGVGEHKHVPMAICLAAKKAWKEYLEWIVKKKS